MDKHLFNSIANSEYIGIITILDYEIRLKSYLSNIVVPPHCKGKKAIIDMALKTGIDRYRFIEVCVDENGKMLLNLKKYVNVSDEIEHSANTFLRQNQDFVVNSFLSESQKNYILCS